jgi:hypothetical protein
MSINQLPLLLSYDSLHFDIELLQISYGNPLPFKLFQEFVLVHLQSLNQSIDLFLVNLFLGSNDKQILS